MELDDRGNQRIGVLDLPDAPETINGINHATERLAHGRFVIGYQDMTDLRSTL